MTILAIIDDNKKVLSGDIINIMISNIDMPIDKHTFCVDLANSTIKGVAGIKIYLYYIFYTYNINEEN